MDAGFSKPSATDERGWLWFVSILAIIYSSCFYGARIFGKYGFLWWDDLVLGIGHLVAFARSGIIMTAIKRGLGVTLPALSQSTKLSIGEHLYISRILLQTCLYSSKGSIALFTRKVFTGDMTHERIIFPVYYATLGCSYIAAVLLAVHCQPEQLVVGRVRNATSSRLTAICALDVFTELLIMAVPTYLISAVQVPFADKRRVMVLFTFRIGVIILSIFTTVEHLKHDRARVVVLQDFLLTYSFMSATILCILSFLRAFFSPFLTFLGLGTTLHNSHNQSRGIALQSMSWKEERRIGNVDDSAQYLRPDVAQYDASVAQDRRTDSRTSIASDDSERIMIQQHTEIRVRSERGL